MSAALAEGEHVGVQLQYPAVCTECDGLIGAGEWARSAVGGFRHLRKCPRYAETCGECFLQHAGECL